MSDSRGRGGNGGRGRPSTSYTNANTGDGELAGRLGALARVLENEDNLQDTLDAIVHAAVGTVPGAQHASISTITRGREVSTRAATDELPRAVDHVQYQSAQGPCLDTLYTQRTLRLADLTCETRWPDFTTRAAELGVGSMLSIQLYVDGEDLGALNLFSADTDAFGDESERVGLLFASHAAVAMAGAQAQDQLRQAMATREVIGQAQVILMERYQITGNRAFSVLVRISQQMNRKLREIAEELIYSGELAGHPADLPLATERH